MSNKLLLLLLPLISSVITINAQTSEPKFLFKKSIQGLPVQTTPKGYSLSSETIEFGLVEKNNQDIKSILLTNTGSRSLVVQEIQSSNVIFNPSTNCNSIAPGTSCSINISFTPTIVSSYSEVLTFKVGAYSESVLLQGSAGEATLSVEEPSSSHSVSIGDTVSLLFTLRNTGQFPVKNLYFSGSLIKTDTLSLQSQCGAPRLKRSTLLPGESCNTIIAITPTNSGENSGTFIWNSSNASSTTRHVEILANSGSVSVTPSQTQVFEMQETAVGTYTVKTFTVRNTGEGKVKNFYVSVSGSSAISIDPSSTCPVSAADLPSNQECTVVLRFSPTAPETSVSSLSLAGAGTNLPYSQPLSGLGTQAIARIANEGSLTWGTITTNSAVGTKSWIFQNSGNTLMTLTPQGLTKPFTLSSNNCTSVPAGGYCTVSVGLDTTSSYNSGVKAITVSVNGVTSSPGISVNVTINKSNMTITGATYGYNAGATSNNRLNFVKSYCEGKPTCTIPADTLYSPAAGGDPSPGNPKDLRVNYSCGGVAQPQYIKGAEAGFGATTISCP